MRIISVRMEPDVWMVTTVTHVTVYLGTLVRLVAINIINIQNIRIFFVSVLCFSFIAKCRHIY